MESFIANFVILLSTRQRFTRSRDNFRQENPENTCISQQAWNDIQKMSNWSVNYLLCIK